MGELSTTARRLAGASIGQGLATVWSAALGLFTTPFLLGHLGAARYGMFAVISVVSSYLSNLEFGFGHASLRFLARAHASGNLSDEQTVFGAGLTVFVAGALLAAGLTFFGAHIIVSDFAHGSESLHQTFLAAVRIGAPIIGVSMLSSFTAASLQALGQYGRLIFLSWLAGTLLSVSAVTIAAAGGSLLAIMAAQLVINSLLLLAYCGLLIAASSSVVLHPHLSSGTFAAMAKFSGWLMLAGVATQTMVQAPTAVLSGFKTTAVVATYQVPNIIFQQLTGFVGAASFGFLPFASAASASDDPGPVRAIYIANLRMTILVLAPLVSFLAVFADPLLTFWLPRHFASQAAAPLALLSGGSLVLGASAAPSDLARGYGEAQLVTIYTTLTAVAVAALALLAVPGHGATGAAFALSVGLGIVTIPFIFLVARRILDLPPAALLRDLLGPLCALCLVAGLDVCGRLLADTIVSAAITGATGTMIYLWANAKVFLDSRERRVLGSLLRRVRAVPATS